MFVVKREVLEALLADEEWSRKLEQAKTSKQVVKVLVGFAEKRGYKIRKLEKVECRN